MKTKLSVLILRRKKRKLIGSLVVSNSEVQPGPGCQFPQIWAQRIFLYLGCFLVLGTSIHFSLSLLILCPGSSNKTTLSFYLLENVCINSQGPVFNYLFMSKLTVHSSYLSNNLCELLILELNQK